MVEVKYIYSIDGNPINEYTIRDGRYQVSVLSLGATMTKFVVRNRFKKFESVHLRYHDYRTYRKEGHVLTSLWVKQDARWIPLSSVVFDCEFAEEGLRFTSSHPAHPITIEFQLQNKQLKIKSNQTNDENYFFAFYLNLSGNLKRDCGEHQCRVDDRMIDLFNPITNEHYQAEDTLFLLDMENGVKLEFEAPLKFFINNRVFVPERLRFNKGKQITENYIVKMLVPITSKGITINFCS